jgi:hypothetical protein
MSHFVGWTHTQLNDYSSIWVNNWLVVSTRLKNMKVSWDDEIPNIWKNKIQVPKHQPDKL